MPDPIKEKNRGGFTGIIAESTSRSFAPALPRPLCYNPLQSTR